MSDREDVPWLVKWSFIWAYGLGVIVSEFTRELKKMSKEKEVEETVTIDAQCNVEASGEAAGFLLRNPEYLSELPDAIREAVMVLAVYRADSQERETAYAKAIAFYEETDDDLQIGGSTYFVSPGGDA